MLKSREYQATYQADTPARSPRGVQVDLAKRHVAETAPFPAPPLDLDENEHASRRISTPPVTMGLSRESRSDRLTDLV